MWATVKRNTMQGLCLEHPCSFHPTLAVVIFVSLLSLWSSSIICFRTKSSLPATPSSWEPPASAFNRCEGSPGPILVVIKNTQCQVVVLGAAGPFIVSLCGQCQTSLMGLGSIWSSCLFASSLPPLCFGAGFNDGSLWWRDRLHEEGHSCEKYFHFIFQ